MIATSRPPGAPRHPYAAAGRAFTVPIATSGAGACGYRSNSCARSGHESRLIQRATGGGSPQHRPSVAKTWLKAIGQTSRIEAEPDRAVYTRIVEDGISS